ncbi:MAG: hypothetical protein Tsb004_22850 [Allomuricauda sp.]
MLIYNGHQTQSDLLVNIKIYNKYVFFFIIYPVIDYVYKYRNNLFKKLVKLFFFIFLLNVGISILGMLLDSELVRSYPFRDRFGYSGLIPKRNEATLFYMLGVSVAYARLVIEGRKEKVLFFYSLFGALILGTKGIYIFLIFLFFFHIRANKKFLKNLLIVGFFGIVLGIIVLPQTEMYSYYYSQAQRIGFFTMLLSGRDVIFYNEINNIVQNWNVFNVFVGGQNQNNKAFEMDFLDLFFFFGMIGSFLYIFLMRKHFFPGKQKTPFQNFFMFSYFFLAFFGGHFFASAVNGLYFTIVTIYIYKSGLIMHVRRTTEISYDNYINKKSLQ